MSGTTKERRLFIVTGCRSCPHKIVERTPNAGYAEDWFCKASRKQNITRTDHPKGYRKIAGYIEWPSEEPKDGEFPKWCPLYVIEPGMYE